MLKIDLHVHSVYSDGTFTPERIVAMARRRKITVLGLTDHDTLDGQDEFVRACRKMGVHWIKGVELSAQYSSTLHILGYRIDVPEIMEKKLVELRSFREERNRAILRKLVSLGIDIGYDELVREAGGNVIARPHFARIMVRKGYADSIGSAFRKYLARGAAAYVDRVRLTPEECMDIIIRSGGLPVLAHPIQTTRDMDELFTILSKLKGYGLWGLECIYPGHSPTNTMCYLRMASQLGLFPTAGSDFHGNNRPSINLGMTVRDDFLPWARMNISL